MEKTNTIKELEEKIEAMKEQAAKMDQLEIENQEKEERIKELERQSKEVPGPGQNADYIQWTRT